MAQSNTPDEQTQALQTGLRNLACQLVPTLLQALREASTDLAMANDRKLLFVVSEAVQTHRHAFEATFEQSVCPALTPEPTEQRQAKTSAFGELDLDALGLVDEAQADREIEVSRTVQLIELKAEWSWNEFQTFHASLRGDKTLRADINPCAPRVFARALQTAADALHLPVDPRALLLRVAARVLAQCLDSFYTEHNQRMRAHGVQPLALKAIPTASAHARPDASGSASGAGARRPPVDVTQPGALEALLQQHPELVDACHLPQTADVGARLLGMLVQQMAQDPKLPPSIQALIAQLQTPIVSLAARDPQLLRSHQHPVWRLIDEMAHACADQEQVPGPFAGLSAAASADTSDRPLQAFVEFIAPRIAQLSQQDIGQLSSHCDDLLAQIEQRKTVHHQTLLRERHQALSSLDQVDQRETLKPLLRKQVSSQVEGQAMSEVVRLFLLDTWTEVMATAMARPAPTPQDTEQTQGLLSVVDDLLQSLSRPATSGDQDALRRLLPGLVARLNQGMDLIQWPTSERQTLMNSLLAVHSQHLRMPPRPGKPVSAQDSALAIVQSMRDEVISDNDGFSGATQTDVGDLPTIPMEYGADLSSATERHIEHGLEAGQAWALELPCGQDVKLFVDGHWVRTRLLWVSANRQFLVFSARGTDRLHTLTQGALARLRREGLASEVQALSLMQRSVDSLLGDL
jgi:hypothetical protein